MLEPTRLYSKYTPDRFIKADPQVYILWGHKSRTEPTNFTGAGTGEQLLSKWTRARDCCRSRHDSGTLYEVDLSQDPLHIWV